MFRFVAIALPALLTMAVFGADEPKKAAEVVVEFRKAESRATEGLTEAVVEGSQQKVWLHKEVGLTNRDIAKVRAEPDPEDKSVYRIDFMFTKEGGEKMLKITGEHLERPLAIVVDGKVIAAPVIKAKFGERAVITGNFTRAEAERIARGVTAVSGMGSSVRADEAEDKAVAFVEKLGGNFFRDGTKPGRPVWFAGLSSSKITDAELRELAPLKSLTTLDLSFTQVTDAGVKELVVLNRLTELRLNSTKITDAGLKELAALKSLTSLRLYRTQVTDAGVKELGALKSLTTLDLSGTPVTDAALKELAALKSLTTLELYRTKVTDAGMKELTALKTLTSLDLRGTSVTDAGLKELTALDGLTSLYLTDTSVTDAALKELAAIKSLATLYLSRTRVTDAGVKELQQALPKCNIIR